MPGPPDRASRPGGTVVCLRRDPRRDSAQTRPRGGCLPTTRLLARDPANIRPVREGASSANIRPVAWFELNRVADLSGDKPQYLLAATRGPEGPACDFRALRVYTWYAKKSRYETAFIENNLCGQLPI